MLDVIEAGLAASDPGAAVERLVATRSDGLVVNGVPYPLDGGARLVVLGAGKATLRHRRRPGAGRWAA